MTIQQLLDERVNRRPGVQVRRQVCGYLAGIQRLDQFAQRAVLLCLAGKAGQIVKARRVQQPQAREMAGLPDLFRRRGQQQQARAAANR